jgi:hypothetical protein
VVYLLQKDEILGGAEGTQIEGLWRTWTTIAHVLWKEGRWKEAEEHPDTLTAMANLAFT